MYFFFNSAGEFTHIAPENTTRTRTEAYVDEHGESAERAVEDCVESCPDMATRVEPLIKPGTVPVWDGEQWENKEDHRGEEYWLATDAWDSNPRIVNFVGKLPTGYLSERPAMPLAERKRRTLAVLSAAYNEAEGALVVTSSLGFRIDANATALQEIGAKREYLGAMRVDAEERFCDADNTIHTLVYSQFNTVFSEIVQARDSLREEKWRLREAINGADTDATLDAICIGFDTGNPYKPV